MMLTNEVLRQPPGDSIEKAGVLWLSSLPESSLTAQSRPAGLTPLHPYCLGSH